MTGVEAPSGKLDLLKELRDDWLVSERRFARAESITLAPPIAHVIPAGFYSQCVSTLAPRRSDVSNVGARYCIGMENQAREDLLAVE